MIVMKFGGTSVESAAAIERVAMIVQSRLARRPVVVVSAMGKTTNALLAAAQDAALGNRAEAIARLQALEEFHRREALPLASAAGREEMEAVLQEHFGELRGIVEGPCSAKEVAPRMLDAVASFGERLSSHVVALALQGKGIPSNHFDSRKLIVTDVRFTQAAPMISETYARIAASVGRIAGQCVPVMGGFIGATREGVTTTIGRGGSDYTAALVGAAIGADEIEIWTDVDGVLTCDPALVPDAHPVRTISFDEAAELAYFGAKVLHPATVLPAKEKNIPVRILNSRRPDAPGTKIVAEPVACANILKSIACKRGITVVSLRSTRMLGAHGFLRRIFEVFDRYETAVDMVATSEVSVSLTVDNDARLAEICADLEPFTEVTVERDQAILCAVGDNLRHTPGVAARVFDAVKGVNVRMISQGASLRNLSLVVDSEDLSGAAAALHKEFFTQRDPAVFG
ncbi:MAG TPA: lysine-sensitive aspartokinase 3 [Candidatus Acidoferrales bacterium]|nr:lysine-sensitive aspartokinase 3 [Candidatus Acidoferrales bacterium]